MIQWGWTWAGSNRQHARYVGRDGAGPHTATGETRCGRGPRWYDPAAWRRGEALAMCGQCRRLTSNESVLA